MINFGVKQVGFSSDINDPMSLKPINIPIGEWWSLLVPKSSLPTCKIKLATIKNLGTITDYDCDCSMELNKIVSTSCLYQIPNDDTAYLIVTILDKSNIPPFSILLDEVEILEFDGGTIDDLLLLTDSMGLGQEELGYGIRLYFDKSYNGKSAIISGTNEVYLLNDTFCLNYSKYVGINFSFCEIGCHRLGFVNNEGDIVAFANQFNVIKKSDKKSKIIEYSENGFYNRYRMQLELNNATYLNEEEQKTLSSGDISISSVIIRTQREFFTGLLSHNQHLELLSVFKKEFKIDGKKALMVGGYNNEMEGFTQKSIGSGTLVFKDEGYRNIDSCKSGCEVGSFFKFEVYETEKKQNLLG